jgi:hypothetical protein
MTSLEHDGDSPDAVERMKSEFLAAQQRRRDIAPSATRHPDENGEGPLIADPDHETQTAVVAVRPRPHPANT